METPIAPIDPKKSLWSRLIDWLGKVLSILAFATASAITIFLHYIGLLETGDHGVNILAAMLCLVVTFFILYILFSLLKRLILVVLIVSFAFTIIFVPYRYFVKGNKGIVSQLK